MNGFGSFLAVLIAVALCIAAYKVLKRKAEASAPRKPGGGNRSGRGGNSL